MNVVSVLILTFNEEKDLPGCLESVAWSDDVVVFDSFSTDRTVEIARAAGARVVQRKFDDYGSQREAARTSIEYRHPWVFALDGDERPDTALVAELAHVTLSGRPFAAYRVRRKDYFMGRWIRHSTLYPSWFIRLYRPQLIRYPPRSVHEYPEVHGRIGELKGHLIHDSFSKGLRAWWAKHERYAELEAAETVAWLQSGTLDIGGLVSRDPVRRRRALKELSFRLPGRPFLRFVYMYFLRMGFLDGIPGLRYCRMLARYEGMIVERAIRLRQIPEDLRIADVGGVSRTRSCKERHLGGD